MRTRNLHTLLPVLVLGLSPARGTAASNSEQITQTRIFSEPLICIRSTNPDEAETADLNEIVLRIRTAMNNPGITTTTQVNGRTVPTSWRMAPVDFSELETFVSGHPASPWTPSLRANLGLVCRKQGRYSRALEHWEKAWDATKTLDNDGKQVADFALAHWASLLASLGRVDALKQIFEETRDRALGGHLRQMFDSAREGYQSMLSRPGYSFQCGTYALHSVATALGRTNFLIASGADSPAVRLLNVHSPRGGFTMKALADLATTNTLDLVAVKRPPGSHLIPVPAVVHWKQNHYAAIVFQQDDNYRVADPTFGEPTWLSEDAINAEASGYFIVPKERMPAGWKIPAENELLLVYGKGAPNHIKDENDQHNCEMPGNNGIECQTNCTGMARWWVSEPYITLWIEDEPIGYQPSRGPRVSFHLSSKGRNTRPSSQFNFSFGPGWECSWMSSIGVDDFLAVNTGTQTNVTFDAAVYLAGGGLQRVSATNQSMESASEMSNFFSQTRLVPVLDAGLQPTGWERRFPDGAKDVDQVLSSGSHPQNFLLTTKYDALGNAITFQYSASGLLTNVVDVDGRSTTLGYVGYLVTSVTDPFGREANLGYIPAGGGVWYLTNIVDPVGLPSRIATDFSSGKVTELITDHHTYFTYGGTGNGEDLGNTPIARLLKIDDAGANHLYLYRDDTAPPAVPDAWGDAPAGTPIGTIENSNMRYRNSFYWGPRQYSALTTNWDNFTQFDFRKGRLRHWLHLPGTSPLRVGSTLSFERGPSADTGGFGTGRRLWYDYPDKENGNPNYEGSSGLPGVVAWVDQGQVYYKWYRRNALGRPTNVVETWSETAGGSQLLRTNVLRYAPNGIDLLEWFGPNGERLAQMEYNSRHQVTRYTNVLNEVTALTYNGLFQVQQIDFPNGVSRTFAYDSPAPFVNWLRKIQDLPMGSDHVFAYTNGVISQWTDPRGRALQFGWDNLQRIVSAKFPDNTYVSNIFYGLNIVGTRDRLAAWTRFLYTPLGQVNIITNALGTNGGITQLDWCVCGAPTKITDGLGQHTDFFYNNAGQLTQISDGDLIVNYGFDLFGRLTTISKGSTAPIMNKSFSNTLHGLPARGMTDTNQSFAVKYDNRDRPVWFTNSLGLAFTNTYDDLNRLVARGWPNGTTEAFTYTSNGLVAYTDRLGFTTRLFRDFANRTLWVTNANMNTLKFVYSPAGDLISFTDGKNQTTTWTYDVHGNMRTNSIAGTDVLRLTYDALNRVTNRWMPATSNTVYAYNALDSVTNLTYRAGVTQTVTFKYDALQRLTNMVDSVGTSAFTWSQRGNLSSEDAPWQNDTVSFTYLHELRTRLTLQQSNAVSWNITNTFDPLHRLQAMVTSSGNYGYEYFAGVGGGSFDNSLVQKLSLPNGCYITNQYDTLGQLKETVLANGPVSIINRHIYEYDQGSQRTNAYFTPKDSWLCTYDPEGQLKSAQPRWVTSGPGVTYPHEKVDWTYDAAENVATRTRGGLTYHFNTDSRNRLTNITRSGTITVAGFATNSAASATVNGQSAVMYGNNFAASGVTLSNGPNTFTAVAQDIYGRSATNTTTANYPATITFTYDANGNMTSDGTRTFQYDAENRLTNVFAANQWRTEFFYDGLGRKRIRRDYSWVSGAWSRTNITRYIYDHFLVLQERDSNNVPRVTYTRGLDLSGSFDGAGGIGGLLAMTMHTQTSNYTHYFYHSDGMGNITALQDTNQALQAKYVYDPWGNLFSMSGALTNINRMRMGGKEWHPQSGMIDFGARFYNPNWQRWINEDPIRGDGGLNLFGYVFNDPLNWVDPDGWAPLRGGGSRGGSTVEFEGEITREIREGFRNPNYVVTSQERFERDAVSRAYDREMSQRYPGHIPGDSYIVPGQQPSRPTELPPPCPTVTRNQPPGRVHGNDLRTERPAEGYSLRSRKTGEVLKYGDTIRGGRRYSQPKLDEYDARMFFEASGTKREMHYWQHERILQYKAEHGGERPPLNKTDW